MLNKKILKYEVLKPNLIVPYAPLKEDLVDKVFGLMNEIDVLT